MQAIHLFEANWANRLSNIFLFIIPFFFIQFADSILSFIFPIAVANSLNSNSLMGIIMSMSSVVGLASDFIFPQIFKKKTWKFFLLAAILVALSFPIAIYLGTQFVLVGIFLFGSIMWGIYFEFLMFAQQLFVVNEEKKINFSKDWGVLALASQASFIIAPILASNLLISGINNATFVIIFLQIMGLSTALIVMKSVKSKKSGFSHDEDFRSKVNILTELKYWSLLSRRVWPAITIGITVSAINATFWTIGGIFGKEIFGNNGLDWLIISLFFAPMLIGSMLIAKINLRHHKKMVSQIALLLGSLVLSLIFVVESNKVLLIFIILASSFILSFVQPLNDAIYSDLLERMGRDKSHLLGITRANSSIAYIITPLFVGILSDKIGYGATFTLVALIATTVAAITFIFSPRKIKLPKRELERMNLSNS